MQVMKFVNILQVREVNDSEMENLSVPFHPVLGRHVGKATQEFPGKLLVVSYVTGTSDLGSWAYR